MIRIHFHITAIKEGPRITKKKIYLFGILIYSFEKTELGCNEEKQDIGFQTGTINPLPLYD